MSVKLMSVLRVFIYVQTNTSDNSIIQHRRITRLHTMNTRKHFFITNIRSKSFHKERHHFIIFNIIVAVQFHHVVIVSTLG